MAIRIKRHKKIYPTTSNINRKNKDGLSSDSGGLSRSGSVKYGANMFTPLRVNRVIDSVVMMTHRGFFVLTKGD